jgi:uncharacterized protein (UPF0335 family)
MENKLDQILDDLNEIKISQAVHTEQLKEYLRRHDSLDSEVTGIADSLEPIQRHVNGVQGVAKAVAVLAALAAIGEGVSVTVEFISKALNG